MDRFAWRGVAVIGGLLASSVLVAPPGAAAVLRLILLLGAVVAILSAPSIRRDGRALPWRLLAASVLTFAVASGIRLSAASGEAAVNAIIDVVVLGGYLLLAGAAWALTRAISRRDEREGLLDGAIVGVAISTLLAVMLFQPELLETGGRSRVHLFVGPLVFAAIAGIIARFALLMPRACASAKLLVAGTVAGLVGNLVRTGVAAWGEGFHTGSLADGLLMAGYVALAVAAVHPSAPMVTDVASSLIGPSRVRLRLVLLGGSLMVPPFALALSPPDPGHDLAVAAAALVNALVVWRLARLFIERERINDSLRDQSRRDPLTGLNNRLHLEEQLDTTLARAQRTDDAVGLLFCDLNNFKAINDRYGHRAGDLVLVEIARRLEQAVRSGDIVVRLAGDEFVVLAECLDEQGAVHLAERIREAVGRPIRVGDELVTASMSVGIQIAELPCTPADLVEAADRAMYDNKWSRGERPVVQGGPPDEAGA